MFLKHFLFKISTYYTTYRHIDTPPLHVKDTLVKFINICFYYFKKAYQTFKEEKADRTFILALDGDVDFIPDAVERLLDRMLKNPDVGAACGRIIPKGTGMTFRIISSIIKSF